MNAEVTIVIPNYNGMKFMPDCFDALNRQTYELSKILVVDNGSTDGSVEWLKENNIPAVFLPENTGFSGAVNVGIKAADTPYVILLNNDTKPAPEFVFELLRIIKCSKKIFSVSSKMIQLYNPKLMDDAGDMYSILGWAYQRGVGQPVENYDRPCHVFSACAGAAIYRRAVFDEIGLFDEMHFAYLEDIDVGYRARICGYHNLYYPGAKVYHVGSGTSGSKYNSFKVRLAARNNIYLNYKNMPDIQLAVNALPIAVGITIKYFFFKKLGFAKDYTAGLKEGIRTAHKTKRVVYERKNLMNYLAIEWQLIWGMAVYVHDFLKRRL